MFTIELLMVDWDDRENPHVVSRVPSQATRLGDVNFVARTLLDDTTLAPPNAYQIRDNDGTIVLRSWGNPDDQIIAKAERRLTKADKQRAGIKADPKAEVAREQRWVTRPKKEKPDA